MTAKHLPTRADTVHGHLFGGLVMILVGVAWLATELRAIDIDWWSSWWGLLLFVVGLVRLFLPADESAPRASRRMGLWLMSVGAWGFVSAAGLFGLHYSNSWPLLIVAAGANIVLGALMPDHPRERSREA